MGCGLKYYLWCDFTSLSGFTVSQDVSSKTSFSNSVFSCTSYVTSPRSPYPMCLKLSQGRTVLFSSPIMSGLTRFCCECFHLWPVVMRCLCQFILSSAPLLIGFLVGFYIDLVWCFSFGALHHLPLPCTMSEWQFFCSRNISLHQLCLHCLHLAPNFHGHVVQVWLLHSYAYWYTELLPFCPQFNCFSLVSKQIYLEALMLVQELQETIQEKNGFHSGGGSSAPIQNMTIMF